MTGAVQERDRKSGLIALPGARGLRWNKDNAEANLAGGQLTATTDGGPRTDVGEVDVASDSYWTSGGCGAFAAAMVERWPHLKIAVEMYVDGGEEFVSHCWAYDGTHKFDIFGSETWEPSEAPIGYRTTRVILDQSAQQVDDLFSSGANLGAMWEALNVIEKMFEPQTLQTSGGGTITLASLGDRFPQYATAEGAEGQCEGASIDVQELIGGTMIRCTGMMDQPRRNPNGAALEAIEHHAVLLNGQVIDVTARQFDPSAPFPQLVDEWEYVDGWESVEQFDAEADEWVPYS